MERVTSCRVGRARRSRGLPALLVAVAVALSLAGCGGGSAKKSNAADTAPPGSNGSLTADRLKAALLTSVAGWGTLYSPKTGKYADLPSAIQLPGTLQTLLPNIAYTPPNCKDVAWLGPDTSKYQKAPAAENYFGTAGI